MIFSRDAKAVWKKRKLIGKICNGVEHHRQELEERNQCAHGNQSLEMR